MDIIVSFSEIDFGKYLGVFELVQEVGDEGEGVGVFNGAIVEISIVLARSEFFSFSLANKEEGGSHRGL